MDEDLVAEMEAAGHNLSAQVNAAMREELERRRRERLLVVLVDQLDAELGPVDEALVEKYVKLLE